MAQQKIELRKVRDFGENISDTFQFLRGEFKPFMTAFLLFVGIFIVANGVVSGINQSHAFGNMMRSFRQRDYYAETFNGLYFLSIGLAILSYSTMIVLVASYMKLYDHKQGISPTIDELWIQFRHYIIPVFFSHIVIFIIAIIGFVLCLVPGIYFWTVLAPFPIIMVVEDVSFGEAFSRCFSIIKNNFWLSLGIYIVVGIISMIASSIISLVVGAIVGVISYFTTKDVAGTAGIVMGVLGVFSQMFYIIYFVSVGLNYFHMVEKIDGEGLRRRLDNLGNTNPNAQIEEQY